MKARGENRGMDASDGLLHRRPGSPGGMGGSWIEQKAACQQTQLLETPVGQCTSICVGYSLRSHSLAASITV